MPNQVKNKPKQVKNRIDFTDAEYEKLSKELDEIERAENNTLLNRFKRKVRSLYMTEEQMEDFNEKQRSGQRAMGQRQFTLLRRLEEMEKQMIEDANK